MINSARRRVLLGLALAVASLAAFLWVVQRRWRQEEARMAAAGRSDSIGATPIGVASGGRASNSSAIPDPSVVPTRETSTPLPSPSQTGADTVPTLSPEVAPNHESLSLPAGYVGNLKLIIPVAGVRPDQLVDTFTEARAGGRVHDAIDIPAPLGTPVLAAAGGQVIKLFLSERGGTTIYQLSTDKKLVFYYAHLQRYAEGLSEGRFATQGETIAFVGDTGNAGPGNYHLHFSISVVSDPTRYWEGTNINPYPLLRR